MSDSIPPLIPQNPNPSGTITLDKCVYQDFPADHIRILQVTGDQSGSGHVISARLEAFHVKRLPCYIASSYAWPPAGSPTRSMSCNGQPLTIAKHVYTALENLFPSDAAGSFAIWIDAICINQANDPEKNDQVSRMASIYSLASVVIAWLGENVLVDKYCQEINSLASTIENSWSHSWPHKIPEVSTNTPVSAPLESLMQSTWWDRLWCLQEMVLASRAMVMCGHCLIPWRSLHVLLFPIYLEPLDRAREKGTYSCKELHYDALNGDIFPGDRALALMTNVQPRKVSHPIDRIYALLSLLPQPIRKYITIDYSLSKEYWKVYLSLGRFILDAGTNVTGMLRLAANSPKHAGLLSWCPDWNNLDNSACKDFAWLWKSSFGGAVADKAYPGQPTFRNGNNPAQIQLAGCVVGVLGSSFRGEAEAEKDGISRMNASPSRKFSAAWRAWQPNAIPGPISCVREFKLVNKSFEYFYGFGCKPAGTYFFTIDGRIGRGVFTQKAGDVLVAFYRAPNPFLLRYSNHSDFAELIGEACLGGFKPFSSVHEGGESFSWTTIG